MAEHCGCCARDSKPWTRRPSRSPAVCRRECTQPDSGCMPAAPRDAATVIRADPRPDGTYEVLLTQRPDTMAFMGGTYVFPGGALDDADASDALAARSALSRDEAVERL